MSVERMRPSFLLGPIDCNRPYFWIGKCRSGESMMTAKNMMVTMMNAEDDDEYLDGRRWMLRRRRWICSYDDEWQTNPPQLCLLGRMWLAVPLITEATRNITANHGLITGYHGIITAYHSLAHKARCGSVFRRTVPDDLLQTFWCSRCSGNRGYRYWDCYLLYISFPSRFRSW